MQIDTRDTHYQKRFTLQSLDPKLLHRLIVDARFVKKEGRYFAF